MEMQTMGKVLVPARIESLADLYDTESGRLPLDQVRSVDVPDAMVDTGASMLSVPRRLIQQLGLRRHRDKTARTTAGIISFGIYDAVRLTVQERQCVIEVAEVPDDCPVLIGQVPLELLDFVVDPKNQRPIGNPDHGGQHMIDMF
jgi:predicted aspartyl protease